MTGTASKIKTIREIPVFSKLNDQEAGMLADTAVTKEYAKGEIIFSEGDRADCFHILTEGRMKIFKLSQDGKEQILHIFKPGQMFGEAAVFSGSYFPASAQAVERSCTLMIPKESLSRVLEKSPGAAMGMLAVLSTRLRHFASLVEDLSLKEVPARLAGHLVLLKAQQPDNIIHLELTRNQLAALLGTIPETLSRILNRMSSAGMIEVQGRDITILQPETLKALATGEIKL